MSAGPHISARGWWRVHMGPLFPTYSQLHFKIILSTYPQTMPSVPSPTYSHIILNTLCPYIHTQYSTLFTNISTHNTQYNSPTYSHIILNTIRRHIHTHIVVQYVYICSINVYVYLSTIRLHIYTQFTHILQNIVQDNIALTLWTIHWIMFALYLRVSCARSTVRR